MSDKNHNEYVLDVAAGLEAMGTITFGERIAVVRDPDKKMTAGGIIIPEVGRRKEYIGTVVALGERVSANMSQAKNVSVGYRVMYTKYDPILFKITLPNGTDAEVELVHYNDLYLGWKQ